MREKLKNKNNERLLFSATVNKFGLKPNWHGYGVPTILVTDVKFEDVSFACDHLWFTVGKTIEKLNLKVGDKITFEARVSKYVKGYVNHREGINERRTDFKLNRPTKIKIIN
jgi:hypothetical protein